MVVDSGSWKRLVERCLDRTVVGTLTGRYLTHAFCVKRVLPFLLLLVLRNLNHLRQWSLLFTSLRLLSPNLYI